MGLCATYRWDVGHIGFLHHCCHRMSNQSVVKFKVCMFFQYSLQTEEGAIHVLLWEGFVCAKLPL